MNKEIATEVFAEELVKEYSDCHKKLANGVKKFESGFISLLPMYAKVMVHETYRIDGYKNVMEFGMDKCGMSRATAYDLAAVFTRFGDYGSFELKGEYKGLRMAQLVEVKKLSPEQEKRLPCDWKEMTNSALAVTVKDILKHDKLIAAEQTAEQTAEQAAEQTAEQTAESGFNTRYELDVDLDEWRKTSNEEEYGHFAGKILERMRLLLDNFFLGGDMEPMLLDHESLRFDINIYPLTRGNEHE